MPGKHLSRRFLCGVRGHLCYEIWQPEYCLKRVVAPHVPVGAHSPGVSGIATLEQEQDPQTVKVADRLVAYFADHKTKVERGRVAPDGIVLSLQPLRGIQTYPHWRTVNSDLVLLGTPADNPLLLDQMRGGLLPAEAQSLRPGHGLVQFTYSPFVGATTVLNLLALDADGLADGMDQILRTAEAGGWRKPTH